MIEQLILNTLIVGSGYALVAMAFRLMYWVSPFFNLMIGASVALGAYLGWALVPLVGWPARIIATSVVALFTWGLEAGIYKPVRTRGASPMILLVVSLGLYTMFESAIQLWFGPQYQTLGSALHFTRTFGIPTAQFVIITSAFAVLIGLSAILQYTLFGKQVRAIHDNAELAKMTGMNVNHIVMIVAILSGAILGAYGIMVAYDLGMEPTMGFNIMFKGMIAAIIGGPTIIGAYAGAMILAGAENLGVWIFASQWRDAVAFVIFILILWVRPNGIFTRKPKQMKPCPI